MRRLARREWMLTAAAGVAACGRKRLPVPARDSITVLYPGNEFDPGPDGEPARFLVFLPLAAFNRNGSLEGRLARDWEHSADYRTWTVHLRKGIRWHDSVPFTAHDVKFTINLFGHPDVLAGYPPGTLRVDVIDDFTYTLTCNTQVLWFTPLDDWTVYYPKHLLQKLPPKEFWEWKFWTRPVGNGPYRHVRTVPDTMMQFAANADYFRGRPRIANVILKFGGNDSALPELISGGVDAANAVRRTDVFRLTRDNRFAVYNQPSDTLATVILWNQRQPWFEDARVRRALTLLINRPELFQALNFAADTPVIDAPCNKRQFRVRQLPPSIPHDPEQAGRLLDEAGWQRGSGGIRERYGRPFRFPAITGKEMDLDKAACTFRRSSKKPASKWRFSFSRKELHSDAPWRETTQLFLPRCLRTGSPATDRRTSLVEPVTLMRDLSN